MGSNVQETNLQCTVLKQTNTTPAHSNTKTQRNHSPHITAAKQGYPVTCTYTHYKNHEVVVHEKILI
jgi:hypothetical protein